MTDYMIILANVERYRIYSYCILKNIIAIHTGVYLHIVLSCLTASKLQEIKLPKSEYLSEGQVKDLLLRSVWFLPNIPITVSCISAVWIHNTYL